MLGGADDLINSTADELTPILSKQIHEFLINLKFSDEVVSFVTKLELNTGVGVIVADADSSEEFFEAVLKQNLFSAAKYHTLSASLDLIRSLAKDIYFEIKVPFKSMVASALVTLKSSISA